ncbi:hypothetical protein Csa_001315 [Cucumis sativus]|uniref:Uncharacterized protein n=1 Tax=Cucumis sativus TaxID=3659 RepID=A0A0A0L9L5_CUCSA|nr:hypothetical protein Csa_001315 [Cucumis sativus]
MCLDSVGLKKYWDMYEMGWVTESLVPETTRSAFPLFFGVETLRVLHINQNASSFSRSNFTPQPPHRIRYFLHFSFSPPT